MPIQIQSMKEKILGLLSINEELRDNDLKLCSTIWWSEYQEQMALSKLNESNVNLGVMGFLHTFGDGKFSNPESIRRCRQMIQEKNPHLRGLKWEARHKHAEVVIEEIYSEHNPNQVEIKFTKP